MCVGGKTLGSTILQNKLKEFGDDPRLSPIFLYNEVMEKHDRLSEIMRELEKGGIKCQTNGLDVTWFCSGCGFGYDFIREQPPVNGKCCRCRSEGDKL